MALQSNGIKEKNMRIISWNVNGYKSCMQQEGFQRMLDLSPDFICLQEVKISDENILINFSTVDYSICCSNLSKNKGRNGVTVFSKQVPNLIERNIGNERFDSDGRYLYLEYNKFSVCNIYMPHGGRDKRDLQYKLESYNNLINHLSSTHLKPIIIVGDFNIAHSELDVERARENINNTMFTEVERMKFTEFLNQGYFDSFRQKMPETRNYTWWPYAYNARQRNIGWRIDYILLPNTFKKVNYTVKILNDIIGSDHCPIMIDLQIK